MHAFGEEKLAPANGIELAYQEMGDPDGEPLILVMGLATQMIAWQEDFCSLLADRGFRVVRFDNRDIGRSTKLDSAGVPSRIDMLSGRRATAPYLLRDMARDTFGLMDHLGFDSAHVVGVSMGGMIVQTAAIEAARAGALDGLDHVDHRQPLERPAEPQGLRRPAWPRRPKVATRSSSAASRPSR